VKSIFIMARLEAASSNSENGRRKAVASNARYRRWLSKAAPQRHRKAMAAASRNALLPRLLAALQHLLLKRRSFCRASLPLIINKRNALALSHRRLALTARAL